MTSSFLFLCCDVEKCTLEHTLDFHIHFETVSEIIVLPILNLGSFYSSFIYNNPRRNSEVFSKYEAVKLCKENLRRSSIFSNIAGLLQV